MRRDRHSEQCKHAWRGTASQAGVACLLLLLAVLTGGLAGCGTGTTKGVSKDISDHSPWYRLTGTRGTAGNSASMWFDDAQHGWFVSGDRPGVWITDDGGRSWKPCAGRIVVNAEESYGLPASTARLAYPSEIVRLESALYVSFNVRHPGHQQPVPKDERAGILTSTDSGTTWHRCLTLLSGKEWVLDFTVGGKTLYALCGPRDPSEVGDLGVSTYLLRSSDGGQSWKRLPQPAGIDGGTTVLLPPLAFVDDLHAWSACETTEPNGWVFASAFLTTADGGKSWKEVHGGVRGGYLFALDAKRAWTAGGAFADSGYQEGSFRVTSNAGRSWQAINVFKKTMLSGIFFMNPQRGWVVDGGIYATSDGGKTWIRETDLPDNYGGDWTFFLTDTRLFASSGSLLFARKLP